jgi:hypothetical protein
MNDATFPADHEGPVIQVSLGRQAEIRGAGGELILFGRSETGRLILNAPPPAPGDEVIVRLGGHTYAVRRIRTRRGGGGRFKLFLPDWAIATRPGAPGDNKGGSAA